MMLAGMSTMLMWESVMRMHTTALAPGLLVKRDLNIQKWHRGLSHVKPETLTITGGWHGRELRRRATPHSFVSGGVTHTPDTDTLLASIRAPDTCPVYLPTTRWWHYPLISTLIQWLTATGRWEQIQRSHISLYKFPPQPHAWVDTHTPRHLLTGCFGSKVKCHSTEAQTTFTNLTFLLFNHITTT